jgi:hypothetical protein
MSPRMRPDLPETEDQRAYREHQERQRRESPPAKQESPEPVDSPSSHSLAFPSPT